MNVLAVPILAALALGPREPVVGLPCDGCDAVFDDDPRLTPPQRASHSAGRGGSGVVTPRRDATGVWHVTRDIVLGRNIPGYPG